MREPKFTPGPWTNGWGNGLTGPTCPAIRGATVEESLDFARWDEAWEEARQKGGSRPPSPKGKSWPISVGDSCIAIVTQLGGPEVQKANARLIVAAPKMYAKLRDLLEASRDDGIASWSAHWDEVEELLNEVTPL